MLHWTSDPAKLIEKQDNRRSCEGCPHNMFEQRKNGWKDFYCELGFNQKDGTALRSDCMKLRGE